MRTGRTDEPVASVPDSWTIWAFSDPHGVASGLEAALVAAGLVDDRLRWSAPPRTALVGCGDYLDRGANSRRLIALLRRLEAEAEAVGGRALFARGNHEQMLLRLRAGAYEWLDTWLDFGGRATLDSFGCGDLDRGNPGLVFEAIERQAPGIFAWLARLPHAVRWRDVLLVHGGLPPWSRLEDLGRTTEQHLWVRSEFFDTDWSSGAFRGFEQAGVRRVVFGHTPTSAGPCVFQDGRALCLDTNACGNPGLPPDAQLMSTLARLGTGNRFEETEFVTVPTDRAPDRRTP